MAGSFGFTEVITIPVAALSGDNVAHRSSHMPWYGGPTLLDYLESVDPTVEPEDAPFRMPVQLVLRASGDFRGYAGTITSGRVEVGEQDRRCKERARRHAQAHRHHGRRPRLCRQGRGGHARARHRSRHLARRGAVGGRAPSRQCRCDRGASRLAVRDAVRSRERLSAPHRDRSRAGDQHEHLGARQFRDARHRRRLMPAPSTTSPIAASCSAARPRSTCSASFR